MKTASAPPPPDPVATANAQTASNKATAITTQQLNMADQTTPYGSLTYNQTGTWADGTPKYSATQTLSDADQKALDQQRTFDGLTNQLGIDQVSKLSGLLSKPVDLSNDATESRIIQLGRQRLDPMLDQQQSALETKLANQGITMGSEAWNRAMDQNSQARNDAYTSLLTGARGQAQQEILTERNQPINEITALMGAQQIGTPSYVNTPNTNVANTDVAGITMSAYQSALDAWKTKQASQNALLGSVAGAVGSGLGGWATGGFKMSDRRVKRDVVRIGPTGRGFDLYRFRYLDDETPQVGFMADEVEAVHPEAVATIGGVKHVHYGMLEAL